MNFYKRFIGDYGRDTGHLSIVEHGAFTLMLDHFYATQRPLPKDKKALHRLLRVETADEKKAVESISLQFWRPVPDDFAQLPAMLDLRKEEELTALQKVAVSWEEAGGLINTRALKEIVSAATRADKNRKIAVDREANKRANGAQGGQQ
jgi:uncharacterized protein YdaU (DUF1376 family)